MKKTGDRQLIDSGTDKRHVRRDEQGRFTESDVGRSLSKDVKRKAKTETRAGQGRDVVVESVEARGNEAVAFARAETTSRMVSAEPRFSGVPSTPKDSCNDRGGLFASGGS
jgi:hypothetical protein